MCRFPAEAVPSQAALPPGHFRRGHPLDGPSPVETPDPLTLTLPKFPSGSILPSTGRTAPNHVFLRALGRGTHAWGRVLFVILLESPRTDTFNSKKYHGGLFPPLQLSNLVLLSALGAYPGRPGRIHNVALHHPLTARSVPILSLS